jgi:capsular polysaccharide biosynthesis protein
MAGIPLSLSPIRDICRAVPRDGFGPWLDGDAIYTRVEEPPRFGSPQLFFESDDEIDRDDLLARLRVSDRQDSFVAHLRDALLVPDVLCVIGSSNRVPFPNSYCEMSREQTSEYYFDRSEMLGSVQKQGPRGAVEWDYALHPPEGAPVYQVDHPHVLLANQSAINYWHFMTEIVPRLWLYDVWPELRALPVIVRRKGDKFEQVLADAIGVPTSQLFALDSKAIYRFKHLIFPSALCDLALTEAKIAFVRRKLADGVAPSAGRRRRFYLSRSDRGARIIVNEAEIIEVLKRYGFETITPSDLSIREQAELFGQAEMLVGPHGAALTNMMFMAPGAVVLELAAKPWGALFFTLASACRLHYMALGSQWDFYPANRHRKREYRNPAAMAFDLGRLCTAVEAGLRRL